MSNNNVYNHKQRESVRAAILRRPNCKTTPSRSSYPNQRPKTSVIRAKSRLPEPKPEPIQQVSYLDDEKYVDMRNKNWSKQNFKDIESEDLTNFISHLNEYSSQ